MVWHEKIGSHVFDVNFSMLYDFSKFECGTLRFSKCDIMRWDIVRYNMMRWDIVCYEIICSLNQPLGAIFPISGFISNETVLENAQKETPIISQK